MFSKLNNNYLIRYILIMIWLVAVACLSSCSREKPTSSPPGAHPSSWMGLSSPDFHGKVALSNGLISCATCHGNDWSGGKVGVSCIDCHRARTDVCISCHGGLENTTGAPPFGLKGETSDTTLAVGAHTIHMEGSGLASGVTCDVCHYIPLFLLDSLHLDLASVNARESIDSVAEITWHGIADGGGATWNRTTRSCTGTYCHGNFSGGKTSNAPIWTSADQATCGSCHDVGVGPSSLGWKHQVHVVTAGLRCADCHAGVTDTLLNVINPDPHVNGVVDTMQRDPEICVACHGPGPVSCIICHGGIDNQTGAPPKGLHGELSNSQLAVGAHTSHVGSGSLSNALACTECHITPTNILDPEHLGPDSIAEITWGALAGDQSVWNRNTRTCSGIYCHGNFSGGSTSNTPIWTTNNQAACGSCHDIGINPSTLGGKHKKHVQIKNLKCNRCHSLTVDSELNVIGTSFHVNSQNEVSFSTNQGSYDNGTCSDLESECHGTKRWYR